MSSSAANIINAINLFSFVSVPSCNFHGNMEFFFVKFSYLLEQLPYFKKEDLIKDRETTEYYRVCFTYHTTQSDYQVDILEDNVQQVVCTVTVAAGKLFEETFHLLYGAYSREVAKEKKNALTCFARIRLADIRTT